METIGSRIFALRKARRLTQRELADAAGVSVDLVSKLEQGVKQTARMASLTLLARALDVTLPELLSGPKPLTEGRAPADGVQAVRRLLTPIPSVTAIEPVNVSVADAWLAYWSGDYDTLAALIPPLVNGTTGDERADAYRVAACMLVHLGHPDLAYIAATKALDSVENDALLGSNVYGTMAWLFLCSGRPEDGAALAISKADEIEPRMTSATPEHLSTWGNLLIAAATSSARSGNVDQAKEIMRAANAAAGWLSEDRKDYETAFGPSQVAMQNVDIAVVSGDFAGAIKAARAMPRDTQLPTAAKARHLTDLAYAHSRLGNNEKAEQLLFSIEQMAPMWMRYQTFPRRVVAELHEREKRAHTPLRALARRLGVQPN